MNLLDKILHRKPRQVLTSGEPSGKIGGMSAEEIKSLRLTLGWSQQKFGSQLGVGITTVLRWERGYAKPSPLALKELQSLKAAHERGEI